MAASVFESQHLSKLFDAGELSRLFTDAAEMRALLLVEGALAKAQGALGVIPEESAAFLHRASMEIEVDPSGLAEATGANGVSIPAFVAQVRKTLEAPEHAQYLHWGATSQDIIDTALMLRLRQAVSILQENLKHHLNSLAELSEIYAETPMVARTWGQQATPTSFGAITAAWGRPLLALYEEMEAMRLTAFWASLSGAAGTGSALGPKAAETRAALAKSLGLFDPGHSWHTNRTPITRLAAWLARLTAALGKMGEDVVQLAMSEVAELKLGGGGGSSTMPQKQNPVGGGTIVALAAQGTALNSVIQSAAVHAHQRDGAAWISEWLALPQLTLGAGAALQHAIKLAEGMAPNTGSLARNLDSSNGFIYAEALSFALAEEMPRPEAQAAVKALVKEAVASGKDLRSVTEAARPALDHARIFDAGENMGQAAAEACNFAKAVKAL